MVKCIWFVALVTHFSTLRMNEAICDSHHYQSHVDAQGPHQSLVVSTLRYCFGYNLKIKDAQNVPFYIFWSRQTDNTKLYCLDDVFVSNSQRMASNSKSNLHFKSIIETNFPFLLTQALVH